MSGIKAIVIGILYPYEIGTLLQIVVKARGAILDGGFVVFDKVNNR